MEANASGMEPLNLLLYNFRVATVTVNMEANPSGMGPLNLLWLTTSHGPIVFEDAFAVAQ